MPDVSVKTLELTQHIGCHHLIVHASKFAPSPEDVVSYKWQDPYGRPHELRMPDYCLTNLDTVYNYFVQYIELAKWSYFESLRAETDLGWLTVSMAIQYATERPVSVKTIKSLVAH